MIISEVHSPFYNDYHPDVLFCNHFRKFVYFYIDSPSPATQ